MNHPPGGPPPYWQPQQGPPPWPQAQWPPQAPPPKKKRHPILWSILAVVVAFVLFFVGTIGYYMWKAEFGGTSEERRAANAKVAKFTADFDDLCANGSVSNAAAYAKPYVAVAFYPSTGLVDGWSEVSFDKKKDFIGNDGAVEKINVVACLTPKKGTEVKVGVCDYTSAGSPKKVDRYGVDYDLLLREAKSGKDIQSLGTVKSFGSYCPMFAHVKRFDPKVIGPPDSTAVAAKLAEFASR